MTSAAIFLTGIFLLALFVWIRANCRISRSGVPDGRIVYLDADHRNELGRPLVSRRYGLTGKPDYLVETADGVVPVEVKSRDCPRSGPRDSDVAQLMAYCVLIEETYHVRPAHGVIRYADRCQSIQYTPQGRDRILRTLEEMREASHTQSVHRDHDRPERCRACGFRSVCDEAIE